MVVFPNAKINLGLRIVGKRADGYHDLETVFYPIPLCDVLEVIRDNEYSANKGANFQSTGIEVPAENNLCIRAYDCLKTDFPDLTPVKIHLHKAIPTGAGLGGGSSDAAFTLQSLNRLFKLQLDQNQLLHYSLQLGSDCPFFVINKPCIATGRGEILKPIQVDLSTYKLILINPGIHISTAEAFAGIRPQIPSMPLPEIILQPVSTWKNTLHNDFEKIIFPAYPEIALIRQQLYDKGALYASMSGSGSTVYGIFEKSAAVHLEMPSHYLVKELVG